MKWALERKLLLFQLKDIKRVLKRENYEMFELIYEHVGFLLEKECSEIDSEEEKDKKFEDQIIVHGHDNDIPFEYFNRKNRRKELSTFAKLLSKGGKLDILERIIKRGMVYDSRCIINLLEKKEIEMIRWMIEFKPIKFSSEILHHCIYQNQIELFQIFLEKGTKLDDRCCEIACEKKDIKLLRWLREKECPWWSNCYWILMKNYDQKHFKDLIWMKENGCELNETVFAKAAKIENLEIMEWLYASKCPFDENVTICLAKKNNFDLLKWAYEKKIPFDYRTANHFSENGNLDALKWLKKKNCPMYENICSIAMRKGYFKILKWARKNNIHWTEYVCYYGIEKNRIEMLEWAIENGCPLGYGVDSLINYQSEPMKIKLKNCLEKAKILREEKKKKK